MLLHYYLLIYYDKYYVANPTIISQFIELKNIFKIYIKILLNTKIHFDRIKILLSLFNYVEA